jgi:FeS assembly SUF system regulator
MLRLSKMTDYALVLLSALAQNTGGPVAATQLAIKTGLPHPTVAKLLKTMHHANLVSAARGAQGGYLLVHPPTQMNLASVIEAIEGPIALTDCVDTAPHICEFSAQCLHSGRWTRVNNAVRKALSDVSVAEMMREPAST